MKIKENITKSIIQSYNSVDKSLSIQSLHSNRSKEFIENFAHILRKEYFKDKSIYRVFSRHFSENRNEFKTNELLYDISVCSISFVLSPNKNKLLYIKKAIWQIESELHETDSHASLVDFNKLVLGSAENKLFICSNIKFLETLLPAAKCCSGKIFICIIPHPRKWDKIDIKSYQLLNKKWVEN